MNYFRMSGRVMEDVIQRNNNVARTRLVVTSNTGPNGKAKNDFFDFVAFGDIAVQLVNDVKLNQEVEFTGHATNSKYVKANGTEVHKVDFVIDEIKVGIRS